MSKFNVGDKVRYVGSEHDINSQWYPSIGTIGTVVQDVNAIDYYIQCPKGSTSKEDRWYCKKNDIELVENVDMTNEEIWKMIEHKMQKNGPKKKMGALYCGNTLTNGYWVYTLDDVHNAIAIAYRSGYERAMKGRPFKIGEKKKKNGHWEPVDPNNLPKEGTRVRYSRECGAYSNDIIKIGDTGVVVWEGMFTPMWFGIKPDSPRSYLTWIDFSDGVESCLDMWVEDDE